MFSRDAKARNGATNSSAIRERRLSHGAPDCRGPSRDSGSACPACSHRPSCGVDWRRSASRHPGRRQGGAVSVSRCARLGARGLRAELKAAVYGVDLDERPETGPSSRHAARTRALATSTGSASSRLAWPRQTAGRDAGEDVAAATAREPTLTSPTPSVTAPRRYGRARIACTQACPRRPARRWRGLLRNRH